MHQRLAEGEYQPRISWLGPSIDGTGNNSRRDYSNTRDLVLKALHDAGVGVLLGTDSPQLFSVPGFSIHREMQRMVDAGLTPYEVLLFGTHNVGAYFRDKEAFGRIAPGHRADMILLNTNPLNDIAAVQDRAGVMLRGTWINEQEIQLRLAEIKSAHAP
jgi:imidazolonepropionase-like amidohydrolase